MSDLINRQAAIEAVEKAATKECARWVIKEIPPVDAVPVVHAHWVDGSNIGFYRCSNCGGAAAGIVEWAQKYCFHCGAKMDEDDEVSG